MGHRAFFLMTSSSAQESGGNIPGQCGMEAGGGNTVVLGPDLLLAMGCTVRRILLCV